MPLIIGIVVVLVILSVPIVMYNSLVGKRNQVRNVFATTDVMLKKRNDVLPNLVATVKGYMKHERGVLEDITKMRAKVSSQISDDEKVAIDNKLSKAVGGVMLAVENYPELKANENFMHLQRTLNELEEQISAARRAYNAAVTDYNNAVEMFPTNIIAQMGNFRRKNFFEIDCQERENIDAGAMLKG